jgi:deazaflavin-dependent oxidoreductase (nitroreductase family)
MNDEPQFLYLTTTGRSSGLPREIEIWFTHLDGRYYLIAEHRERANWVRNIVNNSRVAFRVGQQEFHGVGRVVDEAQEQTLWQNVRELSDRKYGWSDGLIIELKPERSS